MDKAERKTPRGRGRSGTGTIYQRGTIWWVKIHVDGHPVYRSSESTKYDDAKKLLAKLQGKKHRGELTGGAPDKVLISELLDDVLKSDVSESTRRVWRYVIDGNSTTAPEDTPKEKITYGHLRPFFGGLKAARLTTDKMEQYRKQRTETDKRSDATVNRELSILRTAYHNARKCTPPKVVNVPYFPMMKETTIRKGFLSDEQYAALRDALPAELRPLFVCDYVTGLRRGELLSITWDEVDFEKGVIHRPGDVTKNREGRNIPIVAGDMENLLKAAKQERDRNWPHSPWVFNRLGEQIKNIRGAWEKAVTTAGVMDLHLHDLRRTAVRNMRRAGIPQVIRMKISGHRTDSMERRYNIADDEDIMVAKRFLDERMKSLSGPLQSEPGGAEGGKR